LLVCTGKTHSVLETSTAHDNNYSE